MLIQNQVGPIATTQSISPGVLSPMRSGNLGDAIVSELHGRYYETTYRKAKFSGAVAQVTTSAALATTVTGLILTNPLGSTVNLVLSKFGYAFDVVSTGLAGIGLAYGYNSSTAVTQTTPITPKNNFVGGPSGQGLLASAATVPTASTLQYIFDATATVAISTIMIHGLVDLEGSIILPPGAYVQTYTTVASGTSGGYFSFAWEEVPV
jgi:hypothetical protein